MRARSFTIAAVLAATLLVLGSHNVRAGNYHGHGLFGPHPAYKFQNYPFRTPFHYDSRGRGSYVRLRDSKSKRHHHGGRAFKTRFRGPIKPRRHR